MATKRSLDGSVPSVHPGGRQSALKPEHIAVLHDIVTERAQVSLQEVADELYRRCDVRVCDATIRQAVHHPSAMPSTSFKDDMRRQPPLVRWPSRTWAAPFDRTNRG